MFLFLLFLKTKNVKKKNCDQKKYENAKRDKKDSDKKKYGNDFGDEIKECLFVIFASYFGGGGNQG